MSLEAYAAFGGALALALMLTPLVRWIAESAGFLDMPGARSVHRRATPHLGGLALYLAFAGATLPFAGDARLTQAVLAGGGFILLVGMVDDRMELSPWVKAAGQTAAAGIALAMGVSIEFVTHPLGGILSLGGWAVPVTALWIVAMVNAVNLIDGLDGLAAGISCIAAVTLMLAALRMEGTPTIVATTVLASGALGGSALGFLPYNFNPARIFMGDAGSMFLGYGLAIISIEGTLKSTATVAVAVPVLALGLPILDTLLAILRRWRGGADITGADRRHMHHRLLELGLSHRDTVIVMYIASGWLAIGALLITRLTLLQGLLVLGFIGSSVYFMVKKVGMLDSPAEQDYGT